MNIDLIELETLMTTMRSSGISQLTLKNGTSRLTLRGPVGRTTSGELTSSVHEDELYQSNELYFETNLVSMDEVGQVEEILSPSVGIFHHIKPVVGVNATVTEGQVVGHIKTMGLNNEVRSHVTGIVKELLVDDSMPVEYGHRLFEVEVEAT